MNVQILEFYPQYRDEKSGNFNGSVRVALPDMKFQILGVYIMHKNNEFIVKLPSAKSFNRETNKTCLYPFISFDDPSIQVALIDAIRSQLRAFLDVRLADKEKPIVFSKFPPKKIRFVKKGPPKKIEPKKEFAKKARPSQFVDLPKRK